MPACSLCPSKVDSSKRFRELIERFRKLYVESILKQLPKENIHLNTEIVSVGSINGGVELVEKGGARHVYDHVILA